MSLTQSPGLSEPPPDVRLHNASPEKKRPDIVDLPIGWRTAYQPPSHLPVRRDSAAIRWQQAKAARQLSIPSTCQAHGQRERTFSLPPAQAGGRDVLGGPAHQVAQQRERPQKPRRVRILVVQGDGVDAIIMGDRHFEVTAN